jgi:AcrR family transcriptional regulator
MERRRPVERSEPARSDSRRTRESLIRAVENIVASTGEAPTRLSQIAAAAGVSPATAYRHFASAEDIVQAFVRRLPELAVGRFGEGRPRSEPTGELQRWNACWVQACLAFGAAAVHLRSPIGFLARRAAGDPTVSYVCSHVEPLLIAVVGHRRLIEALVVWNAVSDPREVLDLHHTHGWSASRITKFITAAVEALAER